MDDAADFLTTYIPRLVEAETALHQGDAEPRMEMWSHHEPVTLFGAFGPADRTRDDLARTFRWVASRFSDCTAYELEIVAVGVSGDLAYTVAFERSTTSLDGAPPSAKVVRATQVYRREAGEWKVVHRHGSSIAADQPSAETSTT